MNNKGYTLMEVIVSIMILSIASMTLGGAFTTIIHFMTKGNDVKTASNAIYANIEGDETNVKVEASDPKKKTYYLVDSDKTKHEITEYYLEYQYEENDEVSLKSLKSVLDKKIKYDIDYNNIEANVKELIRKADGYILDSALVCKNCENNGYNDVTNFINNNEYKDENPQFPSKFLPDDIRKPQSLHIFYPWEVKDTKVEHGKKFVYLMDDTGLIRIIYNYTDKQWWMTSGSLVLDTKKTIFEKGDSALSFNGKKYDSWDKFLKGMKEAENKSYWKYLNIDLEYIQGTTKSEDIWIPID